MEGVLRCKTPEKFIVERAVADRHLRESSPSETAQTLMIMIILYELDTDIMIALVPELVLS